MTQYGNREWVSLIECISIDRRILQPWISFKVKQKQKAWYEVLKGHIAISENRWTDTEIGLAWLERCFAKETAIGQKGEYRIHVLDGHASHISTAAIEFAISQKIILLCLPAHTIHLLQPLDVGVFAPQATAYKTHIQRITRLGANYSINKVDFLELYQLARTESNTPLNIQKAWIATGPSPFEPQQVLKHFPPPEYCQHYNVTICPTTPPKGTLTYLRPNMVSKILIKPANTL